MLTAYNLEVDASRIEAPGLDPITVVTHDISPGKGTLIVECYGSAWSAWWGGMDGMTVSAFLKTVAPCYLAACLSRGENIKRTKELDAYLMRICDAVIAHFEQQ